MKRFSAAIIAMSMLAGCAAVPVEVKEDMSNYRSTADSQSDDFDFTYVKVADLSDNAEKALAKDYRQFTISDKINFTQPSEINIMSFAPVNGFSEKADEAMKIFFTDQELSAQNPEKDDKKFMFYNETDKLYGGVDDDGFIAVLKPEAFDISFSYSEPNVKIYHPARCDDLSDEYELNNEKCSVRDAVEYVNNWLETEYKPLCPDFNYKVNTVIVREHNNNYLYQFLAEGSYKGVPVDSYTREAEINDGENTGKMAYVDYGIQIQMINVDTIDSFTNLIGMIEPTVIESIDECISLESALNFCEKTFTDFRDVTISDIDIMYTLNPVYETDEEGKFFVTGYNSRPVWEFVIDVPPEEFLADGEINTYGDMRKYIYIDMITGELKYNMDIVYHQ